MKKNLVIALALVFVLGIAGTAFAAANPFVDVPAKHWAYGAVSKLQKSGIVDGYGDGTFRGDKTMTRYEMAQVVAKAMAKSDKADAANKALIDKLAVEFAAELNNLGVRVAKLEKQVGTVKITGDARVRWVKDNAAAQTNSNFSERFRLNLTSDVNENTSLYARIMVDHTNQGANENDPAGTTSNFRLSDAALTTKNAFNSGATVTAGRYSEQIGVTGYFFGSTGMVDGVKVAFGKDLKVKLGYASVKQAASAYSIVGVLPATTITLDKVAYATLDYKTSKATALNANYFTVKDVYYTVATAPVTTGTTSVDLKGYNIGFTSKLNKDWAIAGEYVKITGDDAADNAKAYVARIAYKGANKNVQGTWGANLERYQFDEGTFFAGAYGTTAMIGVGNDEKAYALTATYTVAKNMVLEGFQSFNVKTASTGANKASYSRIQLNYFF